MKKLINDTNRKWWTLGTVCFGLLMIVLDGNVVNLALPTIIKDFGATIAQSEWVNNAYLLTFAILLITFGRLGDEVGRKKMFLGGLITFVLGSFLCGFARNIDQLIIFRIIQGIGGASMMPATLSLISANFKKEERGGAMGLWGAVAGLGIVLGPIVGGYLTEKGLGETLNNFLGISEFWRYVFYINIPIGILAIIATIFVLKESKDSEKTHYFDYKGIITSSLAILSMTYAFIEGAAYGWWNVAKPFILFNKEISFGSISIIPILFLLSIIFVTIFYFCEKSCKKDPLVDLNLFKNRNFSVGSFAATILSFAMMGSFFLLPLFLQSVLGYSAVETGKNMIPCALAIMVMSPIAGKLADKFGGKSLITAGLVLMATGGWLLGHFQTTTVISDLFIPFIVLGIGIGLTQSPLTNITLLDTPEDEIGGASGVLSTARQIGSVMGIAILGAVLQTSIVTSLSQNLDKVDGMTENVKTIIVNNSRDQGMSQDTEKLQQQIQAEMMANVDMTAYTITPEQLAQMSPEQISQYQMQIEIAQTEAAIKMQKFGEDIGKAGKQSLVDAINHTFKIAALLSLIGAVVSLFFRGNIKKKNS